MENFLTKHVFYILPMKRYINKNRNQIEIRTYVSGYRGLGKRMEVSS